MLFVIESGRPGYFLEPRRSCSRGLLLLILCRDARRSRGVGGAAVPFAHIAYCRERASPTTTGGCESRLQRKRVMFTGSQRLTIALLTRWTASWRTTVTLVQPATLLRGTGRASAFFRNGGHDLAAEGRHATRR